MSDYHISGIQQIGIGVSNLEEAWEWYGRHFGMDLPIFNDEAEANLMSEYTGGKIHKRKAVLAMNLKGGGGFEVWQFVSRKPIAKKEIIREGDLGLSAVLLRTNNIDKAHMDLCSIENAQVQNIETNEIGKRYFRLIDPFGNQFKIIEDDYEFMSTKSSIGGVIGATIGVSDIDRSLVLYKEVLGYDKILSREVDENNIERVRLVPSIHKESAFSHLLGPTQLEIVCDRKGGREAIYKERYWGDIGFIHICFDVQNMQALREKCKEVDYAFKVDSENSFDMGEAAGQFAYVQDRDNTLIELVETHKVPILKKLGWYINLKGKKVQKTLPRIIFKVLNLNRKKFH